ncbi:MAG: hypothetical protein ACI35R_10890 [Bacillus sp. (in: firmicutes)]
MVLNRGFLHHSWLMLLLLVLGGNFVLYRTTLGVSLLPDDPGGVVIGSMLDLAVVSPILFIPFNRY